MAARKLMWLAILIALPECLAAQSVPEGYYRIAQMENVPAEALYSLALTESSRKLAHGVRPWPWTINVAGKGYRYSSRNEAYQALLGFMRRYPLKRIDVGIVQVNLGWNGHHFTSTGKHLIPISICTLRPVFYELVTSVARELDIGCGVLSPSGRRQTCTNL